MQGLKTVFRFGLALVERWRRHNAKLGGFVLNVSQVAASVVDSEQFVAEAFKFKFEMIR